MKEVKIKKYLHTVLELVKNINVFIVENIRTSRRFIKKMYTNKNIDNTIFYSYGKHDTLNLQEDFLNSYPTR